MKIIGNVSLALCITVGVYACNNSATTPATGDSLNKDTMATANTMDNDNPPAQSDDATLVYELIESMYSGIAVMKQGQQQATSPAVKELGKKLETAHTKLTDELKAMATKKGWTMPTGESADDMKKREDLAKETGTDYDKDWLAALKDRHETNIKKLEDHKTTDPDMQAAGAKGLPKLKELLASIEGVQKSMK